MWALDNWMYSTYNAFRVRWTPGGVLREPTAPNNSQWGITQDSTGRVWFQGGASGLPGYFQVPIHYGLTFPASDGGRGGHQQFLEPGFEIPWGVAGVGDYQPGTGAIRAGELTLNRVTGAAGNDIVRAHRMPEDLRKIVHDTMREAFYIGPICCGPGGTDRGADTGGLPLRNITIRNNLVNNALKYTPEGGSVAVAWRREGSQVVLEVRDTGIGIATRDQQRVFERFYRADKARSRELGGTGLGLSIVKHLSQAFGGNVGLESKLDEGSTFRVTLPLASHPFNGG